MNKNKIFFTADFETLPLSFSKTRKYIERKDLVYSWGLMSSNGKYWYGVDSISFIKKCMKLHTMKKSKSSEVFLHNFSGFDSIFILNILHNMNFSQRKFIVKKNQINFYEESDYKLENLVDSNKREKIKPNEYELFADEFGSVYQIQLCYEGENKQIYNIFFKCSYLLFMVALHKLGDSLNKEFGNSFYKKQTVEFRDQPYLDLKEFENDKLTWNYQKQDCNILMNFLLNIKKKIGWYSLKLTAGQTGYNQWLKQSLNDFMKITKQKFFIIKYHKNMEKYLMNGKIYLSTKFSKKLLEGILPTKWKTEEIEKQMRNWYRGGITHVNPFFQGKILKNISYYDLNSSYPYQMIDKELPIGNPFFGDGGKSYPFKFFVITAKTKLINKKGLPFIPIRNKEGVLFYEKEISKGTIFYLTSPEYYYFKKYYIGEFMKSIIYSFKVIKGENIFGSFIKKWYKIKNVAVLSNDECLKMFAKICLNSVYGKFATKCLKEWKIFNPKMIDKDWTMITNENDKTFWENEECWVENNYYLPLGIAITAFSRMELVKIVGSNVEKLIYCDTDSVHLIDDFLSETDKHPLALGKWKLECSKENIAVYVGKKRYCIETKTETLSPTETDWEATKMGLASYRIKKENENILTFIFGMKDIPHKQAKLLKRGKVIIDTVKTLKPVWSNDYEKSKQIWFKNKTDYLIYFNEFVKKGNLPIKHQLISNMF